MWCNSGRIAHSSNQIALGGYCIGTPHTCQERAQLYRSPTEERPSRPRAIREILGSGSSPAENRPKETPSFDVVGILVAARVRKSLKRIGGISRPRQEAPNIFSEASHDGRKACPPYRPLPTPGLAYAPWAPPAPIRKRVRELSATGDDGTPRRQLF